MTGRYVVRRLTSGLQSARTSEEADNSAASTAIALQHADFDPCEEGWKIRRTGPPGGGSG